MYSFEEEIRKALRKEANRIESRYTLPEIRERIRRHQMRYSSSTPHSEAQTISLVPTDDAPPDMVYAKIVITLKEPVRENVAAAFGEGVRHDLEFGAYMRVDTVE